MKLQLVLAALFGLAVAAMYPPITSTTDHESRQARYLRVDNTTVVNMTTIAIAAFYVGSVALGFSSVLNTAAQAVGSYKRRRKRLKAKKDDPVLLDDELEYDQEYARYEQELRDYKQAYNDYLEEYKEWAEKYGQDPNPPSLTAAVVKRSSSSLLLLLLALWPWSSLSIKASSSFDLRGDLAIFGKDDDNNSCS